MATFFGKLGGGNVRMSKADDFFIGSDFDDFVLGKAGDDDIRGQFGNDILKGAAGDDWVAGGYGDDLLYGGRGNDVLFEYEGFNRLEGATGNDYLGSTMGFGAVNNLIGGRQADTFGLCWHEAQDWSLTWVSDFRAGQGDKIQMSVLIPPVEEGQPGSNIGTADVFNLFDSNDDGRMDDADDSVVQHGADLHFALPNGTVVLTGVDHLDWSMII